MLFGSVSCFIYNTDAGLCGSLPSSEKAEGRLENPERHLVQTDPLGLEPRVKPKVIFTTTFPIIFP